MGRPLYQRHKNYQVPPMDEYHDLHSTAETIEVQPASKRPRSLLCCSSHRTSTHSHSGPRRCCGGACAKPGRRWALACVGYTMFTAVVIAVYSTGAAGKSQSSLRIDDGMGLGLGLGSRSGLGSG